MRINLRLMIGAAMVLTGSMLAGQKAMVAAASIPGRVDKLETLLIELAACLPQWRLSHHCEVEGPNGRATIDLTAMENSVYELTDPGGCRLYTRAARVIEGYTIFTICASRDFVALKDPRHTYDERESLRLGRYLFRGFEPFEKSNGFTAQVPVIEAVE